jgi:outer membrane protein OmpA-like peptidoglycan-associated protein
MKTTPFLLVTIAMLLTGSIAQAQFGKTLGKAVENAAKNATIRKAEQKTDAAVSKTIDKATDPNTYKGDGKEDNNNQSSKGGNNKNSSGGGNENASEDNSNSGKAAAPQGVKGAEMAYAKSDFVPGDDIIFDDNQASEQMGEFPSQWDLYRGNAEIASINGEKAINLISEDSWIGPLMKNPKNYLGDVFTLEFDFFQPNKPQAGDWEIDFMPPTAALDQDVFTLTFDQHGWGTNNQAITFYYGWTNSGGRSNGRAENVSLPANTWSHVAFSFNKRALKIYINGSRIANVPNVKEPPGWMSIFCGHGPKGDDKYIRNVRIAKGAVPLYDRLASEGKIITYGITFDVGKSTIKPESMSEINRIAQLMKDNPDLKFSVEGHTDNTGAAASNQTLSEARSKAVMDKMIEMGIAADRLKSAGKGQTAPIADNSTDEGRAKNRRVEFVKI